MSEETRDDAKLRDMERDRRDAGEHMTTNQGLMIDDDQNSLTVGERGPTLMEDFHLREKITHFDHERIPERVVHARGAAAHGYFQVYESLAPYTKASLFQDPSKKTPVFVRFSTVVGSRGSVDTPRDVRGFAVKFYTEEGIWDLVGNNIPVFFIQDAIKFPDLIHAVKPEPHNEIPQAQSAHDTFWDFASLTPETTHMLMWVMSDRGIPRSFAMMEGFGVHTFRLVNAEGKAHFVKFHWKPLKGIHSLVWDEAQKVAGKDPDFNRKDMFEAIERGDFLEWELGLQIVPEADEHKFDFDLLDPTKIIPEELVPVKRVGKMVLDRNPDNYFAETEQAAFHPGHVVPGIDFTNDPLLQGRLFSYIDTQLRRVGPNFAELPINRPINPVRNNQRDAMGRQTVDKGRVAYFPNSLGGGCPAHSPEAMAAFTSYAEKVDGRKIRVRSKSFGDHFSQAALFWDSMAGWEQDHIVEAFSFELNMVNVMEIRERVVTELLAHVNADLAKRVADNVGVELKGRVKGGKAGEPGKSPALSMDKPADSIKGRKIAILAGDGVDGAQLEAVKKALEGEGAVTEVIAKTSGTVKTADGGSIPVDRAAPNAPSVIYDAVFVPGGKDSAAALKKMGLAVHFIDEAFAHFKPIAALGEGVALLRQASLPDLPEGGDGVEAVKGVVTGPDGANVSDFAGSFVAAITKHRHFDRQAEGVPA
ncbi:MAG: catalase HPII [Rhodospirillaceae bacterium]|nr:catalase HPII [Rhodospirillaceae bacterium]